MASSTFDVVVIGAGMTGAGVALDAASRGLRVALIDHGDIASGTSSKSSKMVHGGLRYLQQKEFRLVYENLRERQRLLRNAPYLVEPLPFLIPLFGSNGVASKALVKGYSTALRLYDLSGGWRIGHRYRRITRDETLSICRPCRRTDWSPDFSTTTPEEMTRASLSSSPKPPQLNYGAQVATYVRAVEVTKNADGRVVTVLRAHDELSGKEFDIAALSVVNATGVWADDVFTMAEGEPPIASRPQRACT